MKNIFLLLAICLNNELMAENNKLNAAATIATTYMEKIKENNGSLKVTDGVYYKSVTYMNGVLNYQLIYNKNELIQSMYKRRNISYESAKKYLESKKFYDFIIKKQQSKQIIKYCNPNNDSITKLIRYGMKISLNVKWDNGDLFFNDIFSQEICDKLHSAHKEKRQQEKKDLMAKHATTLYKLGIYKLGLDNSYKTISKYFKMKKEKVKADEVISLYGKDLNFGIKVNYEIIQGRQKSITKKIENGKYIMIEIIDVLEKNKGNIKKNLLVEVTKEECIKFYGKKKFHEMQELDILMNDRGNALKQCQKDINK